MTVDSNLYALTARQKELYSILEKYYALSMTDILNKLSSPPSDRMVRKDLDVLRKQGLIRLEGHGKNAKWVMNPDNE